MKTCALIASIALLALSAASCTAQPVVAPISDPSPLQDLNAQQVIASPIPEVRPGAHWTQDEVAEDAQGLGAEVEGECDLASDCAAPPLTSFPQGLTDAQGRDLCPICPRPGPTLPDEYAHIADLAPRCPQRACAPTSVTCAQHMCGLSPSRAERMQAVALPPFEALAQPWPPDIPELPSGADYACKATSDCALGHMSNCRCGAPSDPMNKAAAARHAAAPPSNCPCNVQHDPPPIPSPVCFQKVCVSPDLADEHRAATTALRPYQAQKRAWDAQQAKQQAARATLSPWDEVEADAVDPGDHFEGDDR